MTPEPLELWRAGWVALALWRVVHGEARWVSVHPQDPREGGGGPARPLSQPPEPPAFLPVYVPPVEALGIPAHHLRLWRETFKGFVRGLTPGERQLLEAYLGRGRAGVLVSFNPSSRRLQTHAPADMVDVFLRLARKAEALEVPTQP